MPIYEFVCDKCKTEREIFLPVSECNTKPKCDCGQMLRRRFSIISFNIPQTGRDKVIAILNQEEGAADFPGGDKHRARYRRAMAKGLDPPRQIVGRGF